MNLLEISLLVGAIGLVVLFWRLFRPTPRVRIEDRGILDPDLHLGWIHWDEIEGAYQPTLQDTEGLRLKLRVSDRISRRLRRRARRRAAGALPASIDVRLDLTGTDMSPVDLLQEILSHTGSIQLPALETGFSHPSE